MAGLFKFVGGPLHNTERVVHEGQAFVFEIGGESHRYVKQKIQVTRPCKYRGTPAQYITTETGYKYAGKSDAMKEGES